MRNDGGYEVIKKAVEKLGLRHKEHIAAYGEGNERRLTGRHETADINTFTWVYPYCHQLHYSMNRLIIISNLHLQGVANRGASVRVGRDTEKNGKGNLLHILKFPAIQNIQ